MRAGFLAGKGDGEAEVALVAGRVMGERAMGTADGKWRDESAGVEFGRFISSQREKSTRGNTWGGCGDGVNAWEISCEDGKDGEARVEGGQERVPVVENSESGLLC